MLMKCIQFSLLQDSLLLSFFYTHKPFPLQSHHANYPDYLQTCPLLYCEDRDNAFNSNLIPPLSTRKPAGLIQPI